MDLYTTDAKIRRYGMAVLEDDKRFFPPYDAVLLYRREALERFAPAFRAFEKLRIDQAAMVRLNARAELDKLAFADVAREFLGSEAQTRKGFWGALFAPDFSRLLVEHVALVLGSLVAALAVGVALGVDAAKLRGLAQPGLLATAP